MSQHFSDLPKDPRTLLQTPRSDIEIKAVSNGSYCRAGIARQIESQIIAHSDIEVNCYTSVSLQINIYGVPLFKSSGSQFWPILVKIDAPIVSEPFVVGIFFAALANQAVWSFLMILLMNVVNSWILVLCVMVCNLIY